MEGKILKKLLFYTISGRYDAIRNQMMRFSEIDVVGDEVFISVSNQLMALAMKKENNYNELQRCINSAYDQEMDLIIEYV